VRARPASPDWPSSFFGATTDGTGPDKVTASNEVFDSTGTSHVLNFDYVRQEDGTWNLDVSMPADEGTVVAGSVTGITFNDDGSIRTPTGASIQVQFGTLGTQTIALDLGTSGQLDGLTQFGDPASVISDEQDGYGAGDLASLNVQDDGTIQGFYTNGQKRDVGSFGVATFANESGLEEVGDSYFRSTANRQRLRQPAARPGDGGARLERRHGRGFVHLIQPAQLPANARVITVQDCCSRIVNVV
jgi:flagellar hook protein FlgE